MPLDHGQAVEAAISLQEKTNQSVHRDTLIVTRIL